VCSSDLYQGYRWRIWASISDQTTPAERSWIVR